MANGKVSAATAVEPEPTQRGASRARLAGFACAAFTVMMVSAGAAARGAPDMWGIAALAAAAVMWAIYTLLFRRSGLTPVQSAALICVWSAALYLPAYLLLGLSRFSLASRGEIALQVCYQGVLMSGVALITYNRAVSLLASRPASAGRASTRPPSTHPQA